MTSSEVCRTLQRIGEGLEDDEKQACIVAVNSMKAWRTVIHEMNDVVSVMSGTSDEVEKIYLSAFTKALKIVMYANRIKGEVNNGKRI